jgi:hypothetical protein
MHECVHTIEEDVHAAADELRAGRVLDLREGSLQIRECRRDVELRRREGRGGRGEGHGHPERRVERASKSDV